MPLSSSNTGSTDFRDTEVQQPNTTSTSSCSSSSRAFSANSGQSEAGSTTTGSSGRPSTPPSAFCSSIRYSITSFSAVSLMAMVPDSECSTPTLIGSAAPAGRDSARKPASRPAAAQGFLDRVMFHSRVKVERTATPEPARGRPGTGLLRKRFRADVLPGLRQACGIGSGCGHFPFSRVKSLGGGGAGGDTDANRPQAEARALRNATGNPLIALSSSAAIIHASGRGGYGWTRTTGLGIMSAAL